jgi:hypothetical protein
MSINYYGVATADPAKIGPLVEGNVDPEVPAIDIAAVRKAITAMGFKGRANGTLKWERGNSYVFVDVTATCVLITHNTEGGDDQLFAIMDAQQAINSVGLNVWDPQQGSWFPGSPVKAKKQPTAKKPAAKKTPAAKKPAAKKPAAKKPAAKKKR